MGSNQYIGDAGTDGETKFSRARSSDKAAGKPVAPSDPVFPERAWAAVAGPAGRAGVAVIPDTFGIAICHEVWRCPETVRWTARRGAQAFAEVGAEEVEIVAEDVEERGGGIDIDGVGCFVDFEGDFTHWGKP